MRYGATGILGVCLALMLGWSAFGQDQVVQYLDAEGRSGIVTFDDDTTAGFATAGLAAPNYDWWYGCTPTSGGMMMGYYDRNGFGGMSYDNLVPGGVAELNTFGNPAAIANDVIASSGHIADFWGVPDPMTQNHSFDCIADFMGTSQDGKGGGNGWTRYWYRTDGGKTYPIHIESWGVQGNDAMYGIKQYVEYSGYSYTDGRLFTQSTDNVHSSGFTFAEFTAEIDAGRPMLVHVEDHTMLGYDYADPTPSPGDESIYVYDTWNDADGGGPWSDGQNPGYMPWGGAYPYGQDELALRAITAFEPAGGTQQDEPEFEIAWDPSGTDRSMKEVFYCDWLTIYAHVDWPGHEGEQFDIDMASVHWSVSGGVDNNEWLVDFATPHTVCEWMPWIRIHPGDLPHCTIMDITADIQSPQLFGGVDTWSINSLQVHFNVIPEPATCVIWGLGLLGLVAFSGRRRRRKAA